MAVHIFPNTHPYELLERVPPDRPDRMGTETRHPIVLWMASDTGNRLIPITICGVPPFRKDADYAVFNRDDKSYTTLDGQRFTAYADWLRWLAETGGAVLAPATDSGSRPEIQAASVAPVPDFSNTQKSWFTPERRGR